MALRDETPVASVPADAERKHATPVVLVAGFMAPSKLMEEYWSCALSTAAHRPVLTSYLSPVGSSEDRARQLFYQIKGGLLDFGAGFRKRGLHDRFGQRFPGTYCQWSRENPIHCVGHSFGGQTIRVLQQLLAEGAFDGHDTCAGWIRSITCISSPLNGALAVYALGAREGPLGRLLPEHAAPPSTEQSEAATTTPVSEVQPLWSRALDHAISTAAHVFGWHQPVRCCSPGYLIGMLAHVWELIDTPHLHESVFHFDVARFGVGRRRRGLATAALHCGTAGCPVGAGSALFQHANCAPADMTLQGAYLWNRRIQHLRDTYYFSFVGDSFGQEEAKQSAHDVTESAGGSATPQGGGAAAISPPKPRRSITRKSVSAAQDAPAASASANAANNPHAPPSSLGSEGDHAAGARRALGMLQWHVGWHTPLLDRSCFPFVVHPGTGVWGPSAWCDGGGDGLLSLPEQAVPLHTPPSEDAEANAALQAASLHVRSCSDASPVEPSPPPFLLVDTPPVTSDFAQWMQEASMKDTDAIDRTHRRLRSGLHFTPRAGAWHVLRHGSDHVGVVPAPVGSLPQAGFFSRLWKLLDEVDSQCA